MRRCTSSMLANAASIAAWASLSARPATQISAIVPSSGRARRTLFERDVISGENPANAFGDMPARKGGAADVLYVGIELQRIAGSLAGELCAPFCIADFVAVGLAIFQNLDLSHGATRGEGHRV